jgi:two-component system chemotaxis sensor kinase CheA
MDDFIDKEILEEFIKETEEALAELDAKFVALETAPDDSDTINAIFRTVHSIKGSSAFFNLKHIRNFAHKAENLLDELRKGQRPVTTEIVDVLLKGKDKLADMLDRLAGGDMSVDFRGDEEATLAIIEKILEGVSAGEELTPPILCAKVGKLVDAVKADGAAMGNDAVAELVKNVDQLRKAILGGVDEPTAAGASAGEEESITIEEALAMAQGMAPAAAPPDAGKPAEEPASAAAVERQEKKKAAIRKTLRIEEEKLDGFMDIVGELIINAEVFNYLQKKLEMGEEIGKLITEFKNANLDFNELTFNLQRGLAEVRKVGINTIFQKLPRMVRDLAGQMDKQVEFTMEGEDLLIDKSLSEQLESPLNHMIRNAVDHGMETPAEREAKGKPSAGRVKVAAAEISGDLVITISDDGHGMDATKLKAKAIEKGIITPHVAEIMPDKEAYKLVFSPGFSTAAKITDVSGRGVGMDVVMTAIRDAKGRVDIETEIGKGTSFHIAVPMSTTLITISGLLVAVGAESYIIPMEWIRESLRPTRDQVSSVKKQGEVVEIRGQLYPLIRVHRLFDIPPRSLDPWDAVVMVIDKDDKRACLLVDEIIEETQVVLKDLGGAFGNVKGIQGGAILGDGKVGLVLNVEGLLAPPSQELVLL